MKKLFLVVMTTLMTTQFVNANPQQARQRLDKFFTQVNTMQGSFTQQVFNKKGRRTQNAAGLLYVSRPGKFRWNYRSPDPQEIVGDGRNMWVWDKDLEQVTVKPMTRAVSATPVAILMRKEKPGVRFHVQYMRPQGSLDWFRLVPRRASRDFKQIQLAVDNGSNIRQMIMLDQLGQKTRIFLNTRSNQNISPSQFRFRPPAGVDVIGTPQ